MTRVAVVGAGGRMGQTTCEAVEGAPDLELVARIDPHAGLDDIGVIEEAKPEVAVDFSHASGLMANLEVLLEAGVHTVVGTTGWKADDQERVRRLCDDSGSNCLLAPNFSIGAVLLMRMAALCAPHFERAEIIELHHDGKADAPSGTARLTAELMSAARDAWPDRGESEEVVDRVRGALVDGVRVHAVRLPGLMAHQEVIFGTSGQTVVIRHDTIDRTCYMPGVLLGVRRIDEFPGLTIGLERFLGL